MPMWWPIVPFCALVCLFLWFIDDFVYSCPAMQWDIILLTLSYTLLVCCIGVIVLFLVILIKWVDQYLTISVDELCPYIAPAPFSKNYWSNELGLFAHFSSGIQLYLEARKSLPLNGNIEIQGKFFRLSKNLKNRKNRKWRTALRCSSTVP